VKERNSTAKDLHRGRRDEIGGAYKGLWRMWIP
jgi:hypothetical protein